uniref:Endonuclease/exonuclease/phosphatase domain-containing protein n=1 Tax=Plectus sambesii TaxID=2011161 RepID=A0A914XAH1_9BILA
MDLFTTTTQAWASPGSDAHCPRLSGASSQQGLPRNGRARLKKQAFRVATLNIGTLTGRGRELADLLRRRRVHVASLQETRWKGAKAKDLGDGYKLLYNVGVSGRNGVGIVICDELKDKVVDVQRVSNRLMLVKLDMKEGLVNIVSAYAPQGGCSSEDKADFWQLLDGVMQSVPAQEQVLVLGDLNGHLGVARTGYERVHGGHAIGNRNQEGEEVLAFALAYDMALTNTYFKKKDEQLATYSSGGIKT